MPPWTWALAFIAVLLAFGWLMDRRTKLRRHELLANGAAATQLYTKRVAAAERIDPGTGTRGMWTGQPQPGSGGGGGL